MTTRQVMLDRIRAALQSARLPDALEDWPPSPSSAGGSARSERLGMPDGRVTQFTAALEAVGGEVWLVTDASSALAHVLKLVQESGDDEVLAWPDEELPVPLLARLAEHHIAVLPAHLDGDPIARQRQLERLDRTAVGVTGALAGLADTGSIVLQSGPRRPMTTSLLPLVHVAILRERDIVPNMATFLEQHAPADLAAARNLVFVTGPSRTADIEMIITRGVHGPKRLIVILLLSSEPALLG